MYPPTSTRPTKPRPNSYISSPFLWIDWVCQWIAFSASNLSVFKVLEYAGKLTVLVALITWIAEIPERKKTEVRTAWSIVNAKGGGRKESLEYLVTNKVDLKGLYAAGGYFSGMQLQGKDLRGSDLSGANFEDAKLGGANLQGSILSDVNFKNADLAKTDFRGAQFSPKPSNFEKANLDAADFRGATIGDAAGYRAIATAENWKKALFDAGTRKILDCISGGATNVGDCKLSIPGLQDSGNPVDDQLFVMALMSNIACELREAVSYISETHDLFKKKYKGAYTGISIDTWGAQMTLTLSTGGLANGTYGAATRMNRINTYQLVADLKKAVCGPGGRPDGGNLLQTDLKLREWLVSAVSSDDVVASGPPRVPFQNALQHEVKFVILSTGVSSLPWKATSVAVDRRPNSAVLPEMRVHDLIITFGPTVSSGANSTGRKDARVPSQQASDLHLSAIMSLGMDARSLPLR